jgi:hypothetical protein
MNYLLLALTSLFLLGGCNTDDPKPPEASVIPMEITHFPGEAIEASSVANKKNVTIKHHVKEHDVYVEVIVPGFTFSSTDKKKKVDGEGFLQIYLNNKKIDEIHQAAFIIKGLPIGKHKLKVVLVHNDSTSYGIDKEMDVNIQ